MRAGSRSAPGPTTGADRSVVTVTSGWSARHSREEALDLGALHRGREVRVRAEGRVLGQRDRVVGPGAVDGGARDAHDPPGTHRRGGVEHVPGALDVDPRHQPDVGHGVDDAGEVHDHVDALEQRFELRAGDVDAGELDVARPPIRFADVEAEDPIDVRMGGEHGEEWRPTRPEAPVTATECTPIH